MHWAIAMLWVVACIAAGLLLNRPLHWDVVAVLKEWQDGIGAAAGAVIGAVVALFAVWLQIRHTRNEKRAAEHADARAIATELRVTAINLREEMIGIKENSVVMPMNHSLPVLAAHLDRIGSFGELLSVRLVDCLKCIDLANLARRRFADAPPENVRQERLDGQGFEMRASIRDDALYALDSAIRRLSEAADALDVDYPPTHSIDWAAVGRDDALE